MTYSPSGSLPVELGTQNASILGLGMCVPDRILTNHDLSQMVDTNDEWIVTRTGIRERRITDADTTVSDLGIKAAEQAMQNAMVSPEEISLVICATTTGDYLWPASACIIQNAIGAKNAAAFDISAACAGFSYGLTLASSLIQTGTMRYVLLLGADTLTKQVDWTDRGTCILFGDAAGAAVLGACPPNEGILASKLYADGSGLESVWLPFGGSRNPMTPEAIEKKLNCIQMQGKEVYKFAVNSVPDSILEVLKSACLTPLDIDLLVLHQANVRIMHAIAERLDIPEEKLFINVDKYGNTSSASIPMALKEAKDQGRLKKGDIVVTVGYGAGLTWGANVLRWSMNE